MSSESSRGIDSVCNKEVLKVEEEEEEEEEVERLPNLVNFLECFLALDLK